MKCENGYMKYAVFDWDNTVRNGYTLFSWIAYLCDKGILPSKLMEKEYNLGQRYIEGVISHDEYADIACQYYANALSGLNIEILDQCMDEYMQFDVKAIFPFTEQIFSYLKQYNIKPIVISGAPERVIKTYKNRFNLFEVYAVKEQVNRTAFTGQIEYNYGHGKHMIMSELVHKYGSPIFGFGDSSSDVALLKAAKYRICVYDKVPSINLNGMIFIRRNESGESALKKIRRCQRVVAFQSSKAITRFKSGKVEKAGKLRS